MDVRPNDGEIIVPAGAKAVGQIQEAARSGYMRVQFDSLLLPDGVTIPIQAASQANREISQTRQRPSTVPPINLNINTSSAFQDRFQKPGLHNMPDPFVKACVRQSTLVYRILVSETRPPFSAKKWRPNLKRVTPAVIPLIAASGPPIKIPSMRVKRKRFPTPPNDHGPSNMGSTQA